MEQAPTIAWNHRPRSLEYALRHGYGVHAAMSRVPETRIKKWLGHADLSTTEIYLDIAGDEDRALAARMWDAEPACEA